jgi:F0F1-type ATP synthase assembly protein I
MLKAMAEEKKHGALGNLVQAESMLQLALAVPAGCFAGLLIGYLLDKHFHTHWMVVFGMLLGSAGGFIQIFTAVARMGKRGDGQ